MQFFEISGNFFCNPDYNLTRYDKHSEFQVRRLRREQ